MGRRRFVLSLLLAAGLHGVALWLWPVPQRSRPPPPPLEIVLNVAVEDERKTVAPADPAPALPTPEDVQIPVAEVRQPGDSRQAAAEPAPAGRAAALEPAAPQPGLDLTRPERWDEPVPGSEVDRLVFAFRPELGEGVTVRRAEQKRRQLLDARRIAVAGRTPDEYNAIDPDPFRFKTEQGCYELRNELDGRVISDLRWWRVSCNEMLENPLLLPALDYDALGRAVAGEL